MWHCFVWILLLWASPVVAEEVTDYGLGPGDVVDVQVWREHDLSGEHEIDASGRLRHALAGEVEAAGLSTRALAERLRERLARDFLREPRVSVALVSSARRKAWVIGSVARPGQYAVGEDTRLLDLLFAAGGLGLDAGSAAKFYRMGAPEPGEPLRAPGDGDPKWTAPVDVAALLSGDLSENRPVEAGDVLVVISRSDPAAGIPRRVRVMGEVEKPGAYALADAATVLDAVLVAGGFTEYASLNRVRLVRGEGEERAVVRVRVGDLVDGKPGAKDIDLEAGDLVVVPESFF
ncbi:MAG: polysaccharide biosynthesis/export family protein [Myxococcota bacterium]